MNIIQKLEMFKNTFRRNDSITLRYEDIIQILKLINKPVETTNEQLPINLKIKLMKIMSKHVDIRNSDNLTNIDLYHSFLDWEKEIWELIV